MFVDELLGDNMGQYHYTVNLDKREYLHPYKLGDGLKLLEQVGTSPGGVNDALHLLLAACCGDGGRGGGDFVSGREWVGRWAGDRIGVIGDYAESDDIPGCDAKEIYREVGEPGGSFTDITDAMLPVLEREYECVYVGDGWRTRFAVEDLAEYRCSYGLGDRTIEIGRKKYACSEVRAKLKLFVENGGDLAGTKISAERLGLVQLEAGS